MKITLVRGLALAGTVVAALAIVVQQGYLSTAFTLGVTATDLGLIAGFLYLIAVIFYVAERWA